MKYKKLSSPLALVRGQRGGALLATTLRASNVCDEESFSSPEECASALSFSSPEECRKAGLLQPTEEINSVNLSPQSPCDSSS